MTHDVYGLEQRIASLECIVAGMEYPVWVFETVANVGG